jgi:hypothetical protein
MTCGRILPCETCGMCNSQYDPQEDASKTPVYVHPMAPATNRPRVDNAQQLVAQQASAQLDRIPVQAAYHLHLHREHQVCLCHADFECVWICAY